MNDKLKLLIELQDIDKVISGFTEQLENLPRQIEDNQSKIKEGATQVIQEKNKLTQSQLERKSKEIELSTQEEKIRKHGVELSAVKSNEAYKALLTEIEDAKNKKSQIEDEILQVMEDFDTTTQEIKKIEADVKISKENLESEIKEYEGIIAKVKSELDAETKKRDEFVQKIPGDLMTRYNTIKQKRKTEVIVLIAGESCTGCNTMLTQNTLNEVKKGKELVLCDSCSRILYYSDLEPPPTSLDPVRTAAP